MAGRSARGIGQQIRERTGSLLATANYLENDVGIENPTASRTPIHDHTKSAHVRSAAAALCFRQVLDC